MAVRVQLVHDPKITTEHAIYMYVNCAKCLEERPKNMTPAKWARLNIGYTAHGFQIWCVRHDVNVDSVALRIGDEA